MNVRVRLAPSPTGNLHIGTARTAVFNWLFARNQKGKFILRIEDTDQERSRREYTENILEGLSWLGLEWDEGPFYQCQRLELYQKATQSLLDKGLAYRCYCTTVELMEMREAQKARKEAPRYDNRHRTLTAKQQAAFEGEGRPAVIRFRIDDERIITWNDMVRGKVTWKGSDLGGDMVISRAAGGGEVGQPLYNMAVVVDDMDMEISHVIRGEDHIANTAKQILLYEALEGTVPEFGHTPLILNKEGRKLSKRDGVTSISDFKELGFTPEALANYMCLLGWTPPDATEEIFTLAQAGQKFSFERVNKAGAKFDWDKLNWISSQYLHSLSIEQLTDKLIPIWQKAGYELDPEGDRSWLEQLAALMGPSLTRLTDAVEMSKLFFLPTIELDDDATMQMQKEDAVKSINSILEVMDANAPLLVADAQRTIKKVTQKVHVKKGVVMRSLRASLTGAMQGPDLIESWLLLHQKGFDILRFKKSLGQEIEETKKAESAANNSEGQGDVMVETTTLESPTSSKKETKTTRPPKETEIEATVQKERKTLVSPSVVIPTTTSVAGKTSTETPETETKISTLQTTTPTTTGVEETPETETKISTLQTTTPTNTGVEETPETETKISTLQTTTPTTTGVEETPETETKISTLQTTTPTTTGVGETPETETKISTLQTTTPTTTGVEETPGTETKISTLQTTTPTTTDIETMEQKGAIQVETSTLDEQKPVDTTTNKTIDIEEPNKIEEQFRNIFSNFPDYINQLYQEYKIQLQVVFFLALAILTVKLLASFVQALNRIPILSISFELIGMGYLLWFVYRYLLNQDNRQELLDKIEDIRTEIIGK